MNFKCMECKDDENNKLELMVATVGVEVFEINKDCSITPTGVKEENQAVFLGCPSCGQRYNFIEGDQLFLDKISVLKKIRYPAHQAWTETDVTPEDLMYKKEVLQNNKEEK